MNASYKVHARNFTPKLANYLQLNPLVPVITIFFSYSTQAQPNKPSTDRKIDNLSDAKQDKPAPNHALTNWACTSIVIIVAELPLKSLSLIPCMTTFALLLQCQAHQV